MVGSVNKAVLIGNVGRDPEIRVTQDGREIASLTLATSDSWRDKATGERKERTEWHRLVVFTEGLVNIVKNYVKKGTKLYVEGTIQTRKWTDNSGAERYTTEIVLQGFNSTLVMLDNKSSHYGDNESSGENTYQQDNARNNPSGAKPNFALTDLEEDEIPF